MKPKKPLRVHKFGGTSLATSERFVALKSLLEGKNEIIVVSAVQGVTTTLQNLLDAAAKGEKFFKTLDALEKLHSELAESLISVEQCQPFLSTLKKDFTEIKDLLHAVQLTGSYSKEIQDLILGYGELWSATILSAYLSETNKVLYLDASRVLFIYYKQGMLCIDWLKSKTALEAFLEHKTFNQLVITGFIAATQEGKRTILGRNGSDFSAAIFAKLFQAESLYIWTDVDGIYTADPNRVHSAFVIESLSYKEALELAYFGAKVLHPLAIAPALENKIPIYIKNSLNPAAPGTCISETPKKSSHFVKGLTCIDQIALINVEGAGMIGVSGIASHVFQILHQANISAIFISQASSEHSICFAVSKEHGEAAVRALTENLQFDLERHLIEGIYIDKDCAILSAVGDEMIGTIGITGKLGTALAKANVNIRAISQGSSERNISVVLKSSEINKALQAVHAGFYLSRETISIGLIGPGQVGSALLRQIQGAVNKLQLSDHVNLYVRGIMNSKKMLLSEQAINLTNWQKKFAACTTQPDLESFANHILTNDVPHAVIIDCTANPYIAQHYADFFEKGLHVITPNKHANAGDWNYYKKLKSLTRNKNRHYLYEATVCAGLPVITTLQDLIKTGDEIFKIEGVVSGTLSYLFSELAKGRAFSEVVLEAKKRGYTEPDPREDLSGMDVARKLVCLVREMGGEVSLDDVKVYDLVPSDLKTCSIEEFLERLPAYDHLIENRLAQSKAKNERLCYVGTAFHDGTMQVAIESIPASHPFARLQGTDNLLIFRTKRYQDLPLMIQGPGAGGEVTAAGVFADLLRLVSFLS
jgi:aspartokinase/homoserine dehydrogenase 1